MLFKLFLRGFLWVFYIFKVEGDDKRMEVDFL